jgi:tetratricopeptide (TPR) repeat protein
MGPGCITKLCITNMAGFKFDLNFSDPRKMRIAALIVALITFLVYLPALQNDFVNWDDPDYVYENQNIRSIDFRSLKWMFSTFHMQNWHPLTWLSHAVDYAIWGLNPMGHHLTSIIFHGLNAFLIVVLVMQLLDKRYEGLLSSPLNNRTHQTTRITAVVIGLLFGLHPLHVESVAWISERKDVLYAFFFLLSIVSYLKYTSSVQERQKVLNYILCMLFFIFSLMSKPMAMTLPVVLITLDIYPLGRLELRSLFKFHRKVFVEKLPFIILGLASAIITMVAQQKEIASFEVHPGERILVAFGSLAFYLFKIILPIDLFPLYPYPFRISFLSLQYVSSLFVISGITVFCILSWKKYKVFSAVWVYFIVTLLPVLGIIKVGTQAAADRYTYLPSIGPFFLMGLCIAWLWKKDAALKNGAALKRLSVIAFIILIPSILSFMTIKQIGIWRDSLTLWDTELKRYKTPGAYNNRGNAYLLLGKYQQAIEDFNKALEQNHNFAKAYNNRGLAYKNLGNYQLAIEDFSVSIRKNNREPIAYLNRGNVFRSLGDYQKAIEDYSKAIELDPRKEDFYNNRGNAFLILGQYQKAIGDFNIAIRLNRDNDNAYLNRGITYEILGNFKEALDDYRTSARLGNKQAQGYLRSKGIVWE